MASPQTQGFLERLRQANMPVSANPTGLVDERQPVHTLYGGAHLFKAESTNRLGALARQSFAKYAPDSKTFAAATGLGGEPAFQDLVWQRTKAKLETEAVEDFRIDFEDGFGPRSDHQEDEAATNAAREVVRGADSGILPPFIGLRVKALDEEQKVRSLRTLDLFLTEVCRLSSALPPRFFVTLPKVTHKDQALIFAEILADRESDLGLPSGHLRFEMMVETPSALVASDGRLALPEMIAACSDRLWSLNFGAYDYMACLGIAAQAQSLEHPAADLARLLLQLSALGSGVRLVDGVTTVLPVAPHREENLTATQQQENQLHVHHAWAVHFKSVSRALEQGFYQGWDVHPAQLPARYGATYGFFLSGKSLAAERLKRFLANAAKATLSGAHFDDAATGQGLINFFLRALNMRAMDAQDLAAAGVSANELATKSFAKILAQRLQSHQEGSKH